MKTLLYFTGTWCHPCKMFRPIIEELKGEGLEISIIDIDENQQLARTYDIRSIPTIIVLNDGNEINRKIGVQSKQQVKDLFK